MSNPSFRPSEKLELKNPKFELYEQELQDLNREVMFHPDLQKILQGQEEKDLYVQIADIAAFCEIVLEGDYTKEDILKLCVVLTKHLYSRRTGIMISI